jgi:drug/metabolite transporter (DMT)-like permease
MPAWSWIPITLAAAFAQTVRNASQRSLIEAVGTLGATLVRFLYGLPFTAIWLVVMWRVTGTLMPDFTPGFYLWVAVSAAAQLTNTALLLLAMKEGKFVVAVAFGKTEVLQAALFAIVFLQELPGWLSAIAMLIATAGVMVLSMPQVAQEPRWLTRATLYGLACGTFIALANVGARGAALTTHDVSPLLVGGWVVLLSQASQSVALSAYLAWRKPEALATLIRSWRVSTLAGSTGALSSIGWSTAVAMRRVADVRTLGLVEVLFSYVVSRKLFKESLALRDIVGLALVVLGVVIVTYKL